MASLDIHAALQIPGWMAEDELMWLAKAASEAFTIVEVGAWKGRSTLALAANTPGRVYAVDHWRGSDPEHLVEISQRGPDSVFSDFRTNLAAWIETGKVRTLRMPSWEAAQLLSLSEGFVDLVFIDAGHSYEECKRDIATYRNLVRSGGIISGHDYANPQFPGVTRAVHEELALVHRAGLSIWWARV